MFVHLRLHSEYSVVDGTTRIAPLLKQVQTFAQPAIALSDQMNLFGFIKLYKKARSMGIKPIAACDVQVTNPKDPKKPYRLLLIARNHDGYHSLCELITRAWIENPKVDHAEIQKEWLKQTSGLIVLSGAREGDIGQALLSGRIDEAMSLAQQWKADFGDDFYIELQRAGFSDDEAYVQAACDLAETLEIPVVATHPVQFLLKEDFQAHEVRTCIASGDFLADKNRPHRFTEEQYLKSTEQMQALFEDIPAALANTVEIARRCNLTLQLGRPQLPVFPTPDGVSLDEYLVFLAKQGLEKRLQVLYPDEQERATKYSLYAKRLQLECDTIIQMGFPGYFLIVQDFINWGKQNGVPVGPGRGSGAGSLVAYALGITDLDPLAYDLLFERFLNPERVSMPDFDIDFCQDNRDRVIEYVKDTYGREAVSQIATFGTLGAKAVVRDVGRVLELPYGLCDSVSKMIPNEPANPWSLERTLAEVPEFKKLYDTDEDVRNIVDLSLPLEGLTRNIGMHAGGVLIAPGKLTDFCPLYCQPGHADSVVSQYDKGDVEEAGLVKFDFLGLRNLTILDWAVRFVREFNPHQKDFDVMKLPLDDPETFALLSAGNTTAVFQLESRGMKQLLKKLQPSTFEDIIAVCALFRPGPLDSGMVDDFVDRKHGRAEIDYFHPDLESTLSSTYGVIVYQEQVMLISQIIGGYSLGGADLLRRAMGKKKPEEMAKHRSIFQEGAVKKGYDSELAVKLFDLMEKFAGYGFNKSHSAAYALIAWQTAWLKVHFPAEFMAASLSSDMESVEKVQTFLEDAQQNGLHILPPDINLSDYRFTPVWDEYTDQGRPPKTIRYGLGAIKGVGQAAVDSLIAERQAHGPYLSLYDFCVRNDKHTVSRRTIEGLIKAGAFDSICSNRAALLGSVSICMETATRTQANTMQNSLFGDESAEVVDDLIQDIPDWSLYDKLQEEKAILGFCFSQPLFDVWRNEIRRFVPITLLNSRKYAKDPIPLAGVLESVRYINRDQGRIYILMLNDGTATIELSLNEALYQSVRDDLKIDQPLIVQSKVSMSKMGDWRYQVHAIFSLDRAREQFADHIKLYMDKPEQLQALKTCLPQHAGNLSVCVQVDADLFSCQLQLASAYTVSLKHDFLTQLDNLGIRYYLAY